MDLTTREPQVMVGRTVKIATVAFAIAVGVHGLDHLRRGLDVVQMPVAVDGTLQMILAVIVAALVLREHRWSLTAATLLGFGGVILFGQAHLLPHWGPFSDSFISAPRGDLGNQQLFSRGVSSMQTSSFRLTKVIIGRRFKELDRRYQLRLQPAASLHVFGGQASPHLPLPDSEIPKRAFGDRQTIEIREYRPTRSWREY